MKKRYNLTSRQKQELVQQIGLHLKEGYPQIVSAYVFGSFNTDKPFADLDLALLLRKNPAAPLEFELTVENSLEQICRLPVDVRVLNTAPLAFRYQVFRGGRLLFDKNANLRADFEGQSLKQYYEIARFRKRYLKEALHAPL